MSTHRHRTHSAVAALLVLACGPTQPNTDYRSFTDTYSFRVSMDPLPPSARERILFKVVVRDRESGQPIEGGEGQIFATSRDGANTWDSFTAGPELGTYYGTLNFVTAGEWAVALRFRQDSTKPLERIDWMQDVRPERSGPP